MVRNIFIDDGGVMSENALRGAQWQRMVAEFFVPRLGGDHESWANANRRLVERMALVWASRQCGIDVPHDWQQMWRQDELDWLRSMCADVGVAAPDDDECIWLALACTRYVTHRVEAAQPGAADAVRLLAAQADVVLFTASGETSWELEGYLTAMGVRDLFRGLYGPDLVSAAKGSQYYYSRVFAQAGVDPSTAIVVDDSPGALTLAAQAGARTFLVPSRAFDREGLDAVISRLADLPALLRTGAHLP